MIKKKTFYLLLSFVLIAIIVFVLYRTDFVQDRMGGRVGEWKAQIFYFFNPPEDVVFNPGETNEFDDEVAQLVKQTMDAFAVEITQTAQAQLALLPTATPEEIITAEPTVVPTIIPTPIALPDYVKLDGISYFHQHGVWNYCAPANLAMALSYWGWGGTREDTGDYLRGGNERVDDKNVMPYEMVNYIVEETPYYIVSRSGGTLQILKELLAMGYPVVVEKDFFLDGIGWMGHFLTLNGFDETTQEFLSYDSYIGENQRIGYQELEISWQSFNYLFMVIYPPNDNQKIYSILGNYADPSWAYQAAMDRANFEKDTLTGMQQYFAWINLGASYIGQGRYSEAALAYDTSYALYENLPVETRPWRINWYQTGPYKAYFNIGRYQDVINLADTILDAMREPILEESFYWRGLAKEALGDRQGAIEDLRYSVYLNKNFGAGWAELNRIEGGQ